MANRLLSSDSYKASHFLQYPRGTTEVFSYIEARGVDKSHEIYMEGEEPVTVMFGLTPFLRALAKPITPMEVDRAEEYIRAQGMPFNKEGWEIVLRDHLGQLPLEVRAVPEGSVVPVSNALVTVRNLDRRLPWLTSYFETALLRAAWYGTTVATNSYLIKRDIARYMMETAGHIQGLEFKLHDFGARGVSSEESARIGGAAHLVNFCGTDTMTALEFIEDNYRGREVGFSVPAAEHSTITVWGRENEAAAYENMIDQFGGRGNVLAIVSDSYDLFGAIKNIYGGPLKDKIVNNGGTVVIRPDSGAPEHIVPRTIIELMEVFGSVTNNRGYLELPPYVRVIQGDGINRQSINAVLSAMKGFDLSADNITFGMGGALLQQVNRDTFKFAMKASAAKVNGEWRDVYKDPATDSGKASKRGRLDLIHENGKYRTVRLESDVPHERTALTTVFFKGNAVRSDGFTMIRARAEAAFRQGAIDKALRVV